MPAKSNAVRGRQSAASVGGTATRTLPPRGIEPTPEPVRRAPTVFQAAMPQNSVATPQPVSHEPQNGVSPFMVSSLPSIASGADIYARQFYRGSTLPFRRYLPVNLK